MKKGILITVPILICSLLLLSSSAFAIPFSMSNSGSDDVSDIQVTIDNLLGGGVKVYVDVSGGPVIGDITGVFFDMSIAPTSIVYVDSSPNTLPSTLDFTYDPGNVKKAPNGSNINLDPKFDVGVSIGAGGLSDGGSPDDIQWVKFNVLGPDLDVTDITRMGVRLQSVGTIGSGREGSAKYVGAQAPEPASMLLFGAGLAGLGVFRRRFRKR